MLFAKTSLGTAENEHLKVWGSSTFQPRNLNLSLQGTASPIDDVRPDKAEPRSHQLAMAFNFRLPIANLGFHFQRNYKVIISDCSTRRTVLGVFAAIRKFFPPPLEFRARTRGCAQSPELQSVSGLEKLPADKLDAVLAGQDKNDPWTHWRLHKKVENVQGELIKRLKTIRTGWWWTEMCLTQSMIVESAKVGSELFICITAIRVAQICFFIHLERAIFRQLGWKSLRSVVELQ